MTLMSVALSTVLLVADLSTGASFFPPAAASVHVSEADSTRAAAARAAGSSANVRSRLTRGFYVDPESQAMAAAARDRRIRPIARTPQAKWLTDVTAPLGSATAVSRSYAQAATKADRTPVVVLYAIPGRDCGLHSRGGYPVRKYRSWIREVAAGLEGQRPLAVLEPDAVASLGDCAGQGPRAAMLRYAAKELTGAGAWVYLDAGHSGWRPPEVIASRLRKVGVRHARGFATNVSNFRTTAAERRFGGEVRRQLRRAGVPGKRFVVDISRNGAGPAPESKWCNPPHARLGKRPRVVRKGGLDVLLWVKRPGESDGQCQGGPYAGHWWHEGALRLLAR